MVVKAIGYEVRDLGKRIKKYFLRHHHLTCWLIGQSATLLGGLKLMENHIEWTLRSLLSQERRN